MAQLKRGTTPTISVKFEDLNPSLVSGIEFVFKASPKQTADALVTKAFPDSGVTYNAESGTYDVALTDAETRTLTPYSKVYMDTRVTLTGGGIPPTNMILFDVMETLFPPRVTSD